MWISKYKNGFNELCVVITTLKPELTKGYSTGEEHLHYIDTRVGKDRNFLYIDSSIFPDLKLHEVKWTRFCKKEWVQKNNTPYDINTFYKNVCG